MNDFLCHRLVIRGIIEIPQSLHVGSGESSIQTDATIRRDKNGQPYIPGSTLGGLLRATAQDFVPKSLIEALFGCAGDTDIDENSASRVIVEDANILVELPPASEVRDYVGIDRRMGVSQEHLKYNREVSPSKTSYHFEISIEKPTGDEIRLILAVLDFWSRFDFAFHIGGRTTTGLGKAKLRCLRFYKLNFGDRKFLLQYLLKGNPNNPEDYLPETAKIERKDLDDLVAAKDMVWHIPTDDKPFAEAFRPQHLLMNIILIPEEPILVQGSVPEIPEMPEDDEEMTGLNRTSDADFVTALTVVNGSLSDYHYIPGSSLKGILRTRAEKIIRTLNYHRYDPVKDTNFGNICDAYKARVCACAITHGEEEDFSRLEGCFGTPKKQQDAKGVNARKLYDKSCVTCRVFGNSMMRGRLHVSDAELITDHWSKLFDHVSIDRFHGGAKDEGKFDTRPLMPYKTSDGFQPVFAFQLHLERPEPWMLGLLGHLLKDLITSDIRLGSNIHRGYGKVKGFVCSSQLLILEGSELHNICKNKLSIEERLGPYLLMDLGLSSLFGQEQIEQWENSGLNSDALKNPTVSLLEKCHQDFQNLIINEEGRLHGKFIIS